MCLPSRTQSECCICEMRSDSGESTAGISGVRSKSGRSLRSCGICGMARTREAISRVVVRSPFSCVASSSRVAGSASSGGRGFCRISMTLSRSFVLLLLYPSRHDESCSGTIFLLLQIALSSCSSASDWSSSALPYFDFRSSISSLSVSRSFFLLSISFSFDMLCSPRKKIPFSAS